MLLVFRRDSQHGVHQPVSNDQLLEESPGYQQDAQLDVGKTDVMTLVELPGQVAVKAYRSLHYLREERREQQHFAEITLRGELLTINVDDVPH